MSLISGYSMIGKRNTQAVCVMLLLVTYEAVVHPLVAQDITVISHYCNENRISDFYSNDAFNKALNYVVDEMTPYATDFHVTTTFSHPQQPTPEVNCSGTCKVVDINEEQCAACIQVAYAKLKDFCSVVDNNYVGPLWTAGARIELAHCSLRAEFYWFFFQNW